MDKGRHCSSVRYSHVSVAESKITKDYVKNNLYVHRRVSSDADIAA